MSRNHESDVDKDIGCELVVACVDMREEKKTLH
jgi:hypothetical protein